MTDLENGPDSLNRTALTSRLYRTGTLYDWDTAERTAEAVRTLVAEELERWAEFWASLTCEDDCGDVDCAALRRCASDATDRALELRGQFTCVNCGRPVEPDGSEGEFGHVAAALPSGRRAGERVDPRAEEFWADPCPSPEPKPQPEIALAKETP